MWTQWKEFQQSANVRCSYLQGALLSQRWRGWLTALPLSLWVKLLLFIADPLAILDLSFRVVVLSFRLLLSLLFLTQFFADDVQPPLLAVRHVLLLLLPPPPHCEAEPPAAAGAAPPPAGGALWPPLQLRQFHWDSQRTVRSWKEEKFLRKDTGPLPYMEICFRW